MPQEVVLAMPAKEPPTGHLEETRLTGRTPSRLPDLATLDR